MRQMIFHRSCSLLGLTGLLFAAEVTMANTTDASAWNVSGDFSLRSEYYENDGNPAVSPYRYEKSHFSGNLDLQFDRQYSPYETIRGQLSAIDNHSDYINESRDMTLQRFALTWEKGDSGLPYRLGLGDYYGFLSTRTMQLSLKGVQLELQPNLETADTGHSMMLFAGTPRRVFHDLNADDDMSYGVSWLLQNDDWGEWALNLVQNESKADSVANFSAISQTLFGFSGGRDLQFAGELMSVDGEVSLFSGDWRNGSSLASDRNGSAVYFELGNRGNDPLNYSFVHERYGQDYKPVSASVSADYRSDAVRAGWGFANGLKLQGRILDDHSNRSASDPVRNTTLGATLSGPLQGEWFESRFSPWVSGLSINLDTYRLGNRNLSRSTNNLSLATNISVSGQLWNDWNITLGTQYQRRKDYTTGDVSLNRMLSGNLNRPIQVGAFKGSISPGLQIRRDRLPSSNNDLGLNLGMNLAAGDHSLQLSLNHLYQNRPDVSGQDVTTSDAAVKYGYTQGPHQVSVDFAMQRYDSQQNGENDAYKLGFLYSYNFDTQIGQKGRADSALELDETQGFRDLGEGFRLARLVAHMPIQVAQDYLSSVGVTGASQLNCCKVYENRVYSDIYLRQRVFVAEQAGTLQRAGVIIDFDSANSANSEGVAFNKVLNLMLERYGAPATSIEKGEFSNDYVRAVNTDTLVRIYEWRTDFGRLRLGLPKRLDRQVRIEFQHAKRFPVHTDGFWSMEEIH